MVYKRIEVEIEPGRVVSRQRAWQLANPDKDKAMKDHYYWEGGGKERHKELQRKYRAEKGIPVRKIRSKGIKE
jgi:hypothetical protein